MPHQGLFTLPPSRLDIAISKRAARLATPPRQRILRVTTWLADEKILLGAVGLFWLSAQLRSPRDDLRQEANLMLLSVSAAGLLPHLFKYLVDRKRPDRVLVHGRRRGIPRSGDPWDSFPSGHALHLGALAGPLTRIAPKQVRPLVWLGIFGLASTRILLLAHYTSDVIAGFGFGAALAKAIRHALSPRRQS